MIAPAEKSDRFSLIGTITHDAITTATGRFFHGLGGILYQAAALCGLGKHAYRYTQLGKDLSPEVKKSRPNGRTSIPAESGQSQGREIVSFSIIRRRASASRS